MTNNKKTYFITGGGTGGHIYPAVSVMQNLLGQSDTEKIYYIGNPKNMEYDIVKKINGVEFLPIDINGMPRKFGLDFLIWLFKFEIALWKALSYLLKYKPDAVFATGGYVSAPIAFMAGLLKKPLMLHDCDSVPGLVSKYAAPLANVVSVAFESAKKVLKSDKVIVTGNPIRQDFGEVSKEQAREKLGLREGKFTIFITGGSQGAKTLNDAGIYIAQHIVEAMDNQLIIQTGKKNYDEVIKRLDEYFPNHAKNTNLIIKPYFDDMIYPLKAADIVISRAGSLILSEINICGLPAILVPYPHAAADHQRQNAKEAEKAGFAVWYDDAIFDGKELQRILYSIFFNEKRLMEMCEKSHANAKPEALNQIIDTLKSLIK